MGTTATVIADAFGVATAPTFTAGNLTGSYNVTVSAPGVAMSTLIPLTNNAGAPAFIEYPGHAVYGGPDRDPSSSSLSDPSVRTHITILLPIPR